MSALVISDTATSEIYTLSLHDALPISPESPCDQRNPDAEIASARLRQKYDSEREERHRTVRNAAPSGRGHRQRSEEHTSELQSRRDLVCRLLLEKKKINNACGISDLLI